MTEHVVKYSNLTEFTEDKRCEKCQQLDNLCLIGESDDKCIFCTRTNEACHFIREVLIRGPQKSITWRVLLGETDTISGEDFEINHSAASTLADQYEQDPLADSGPDEPVTRAQSSMHTTMKSRDRLTKSQKIRAHREGISQACMACRSKHIKCNHMRSNGLPRSAKQLPGRARRKAFPRKQSEPCIGKRFVCTVPGCNTRVSSKRSLEKHKNTKHELVKAFHCPVDDCEERFPRKDYLKNHCRKAHPKEDPEELVERSTMGLVMPKVQKPHLTSEPDTDDEWRELSEEL